MAEPDDDRDALTWEGDEIVVDELASAAEPEPVELDADDDDTSQVHEAPAATGAARLASFGLLVIAIAAAAGWVVVMLGNPIDTSSMSLFGLAMYQLGELLAVVAPVLWWFMAGRLERAPLAWRCAGAVVTAPWPLLVSLLGAGAMA